MTLNTPRAESDAIVASLELAAERCEDLTPLVYERLFEVRPDTRGLFRTDPKDFIKGSMLQLSLDAILDFAGERKAAHRLIFAEVQSHDAYGTSPELFNVFFEVIGEVVKDLLKQNWTPAMDAAWKQLKIDLDRYLQDAIRAMAPAG